MLAASDTTAPSITDGVWEKSTGPYSHKGYLTLNGKIGKLYPISENRAILFLLSSDLQNPLAIFTF